MVLQNGLEWSAVGSCRAHAVQESGHLKCTSVHNFRMLWLLGKWRWRWWIVHVVQCCTFTARNGLRVCWWVGVYGELLLLLLLMIPLFSWVLTNSRQSRAAAGVVAANWMATVNIGHCHRLSALLKSISPSWQS